MMVHKQETVDANVNGVAFLLKKNKIEPSTARPRSRPPARSSSPREDGKTQELETKASSSRRARNRPTLPGVSDRREDVVTSTGALELTAVPKELVVVGAGVIGLEIGSVWSRLGAKVTVVEYLDRILPGMDGEIAKQFQRILEKQGFTFQLGSKVTKVETAKKGGATVTVEPRLGARPRRFRPISCWSRSAAVRTRMGSAWKRPASRPSAAASSSTIISRPMSPASTPSATWCAGRCWPTRPRTRAWPSPRSSPARPAM
jgi:hypothetical protein